MNSTKSWCSYQLQLITLGTYFHFLQSISAQQCRNLKNTNRLNTNYTTPTPLYFNHIDIFQISKLFKYPIDHWNTCIYCHPQPPNSSTCTDDQHNINCIKFHNFAALISNKSKITNGYSLYCAITPILHGYFHYFNKYIQYILIWNNSF